MKQLEHLGSLAQRMASLLLVAGVAGCTFAAPSPTQLPAATAAPTLMENDSLWQVELQTEVEQPTRMAAFLNEKVGFTGGAQGAGRAHYTADGGQTWTLAETSTG